MIRNITSQIIKNLSFRKPLESLNYEVYSKLNIKELEIIKNNFGLKEYRLKKIDCFSCGEECEIRIKNEQKFIHCRVDDCNARNNLDDNQDLAYKITLNDIANFLIKLLEIEKRHKKTLIAGEVICLGKKELEDLGISFDLYLVRNEQNKKVFLSQYHPQSKTIPAIVIRLGNRGLNFEEKQITECWFYDLVFYDYKLRKFQINKSNLDVLVSDFKAAKDLENYQKIIKDNNKTKYGKGGKIKAENDYGGAKEYVLNEYKKLKSQSKNKKDISRIISDKFPISTFPVIPTDETIYRWLLKAK